MASVDDLDRADPSITRDVLLEDATVVTGEAKPLPPGAARETIYFENVKSVKIYLRGGPTVSDHLRATRGIFYLIVATTFATALAFIGAGLGLVYLGATGGTELGFFGLRITSTNVGIVSVALGAVVLIVVMKSTLLHIQGIIGISFGKGKRG
jgi:hypothetical protein